MTPREDGAPYHHGRLRAELLKRAGEDLEKVGLDGLSLRQLARNVNVSSAAPRRHFRDKAALLDALALDGFTRLEVLYAAIVETGSFREDFGALSKAYLAFAEQNPALLDLMLSRKYDVPAIGEALQRLMDRMVGIVRRAQGRGEVRPGDPAEIASASFAPILGIGSSVRAGIIVAEDVDAVLGNTIDIVVQGLLPKA